MIKKEASWLGKEILALINDFERPNVLNVGSSTEAFRKNQQPHIDQEIFSPLRKAQVRITHLDMKKEDGVDIVGDLTDKIFLEEIQKSKYNIILCNNLLEHVETPQDICSALYRAVEPGGYIVLSVPPRYPYHSDPIDTMLRPSPEELHKFFPKTQIVKAEIVEIPNTHFQLLMANPKHLLIFCLRCVTPFYKPGGWRKIVSGIPHLFKSFQVSCLIIKKTNLHRV